MADWAGLAAQGTLSYNGVAFTDAMSLTVSQEAVLDDAGMGTKYSEFTIRVRGVLSIQPGDDPNDTTDSEMEYIRQRLCKFGGHLLLDQKGAGFRLDVNNPSGGLCDVNFGPRPQLLAFTPLGGNRAAEVEWAVKVYVPHCYYFPNVPTQGIMSFHYGMSYHFDDGGFLTRTINGKYEIAMTTKPASRARDNRILPDSAEEYWLQIYRLFPRVKACTRTVNRTLSPNTKVMDFIITDAEVASPNPYPEGVRSIRATHRVGWSRSDQLKPRNVISAAITLTPDLQGTWAWAIFVQLVRQRMNWALSHSANEHNWVMLDSITMEEDIFGFTHQFSASYRFSASVQDLLGASGLWTPIGTDWDRWEYALDRRGVTAKLSQTFHAPRQVYDLCGGQLTGTNRYLRLPAWDSPPGRNVLENSYPPRDRSWQNYDVAVMPYRDRSVSRQQILSPSDNPSSQMYDGPFQYEGVSASGSRGNVSGKQSMSTSPGVSPDNPWLNPPAPPRDTTPPYPPPDQGRTSRPVPQPDIIHQAGQSAYSFLYIGRAVRVGWEIPRQHLAVVGGQPTTEVSNKHVVRTIGDYRGVPVYSALWCHHYIVPAAPAIVDAWSTGQAPRWASDW